MTALGWEWSLDLFRTNVRSVVIRPFVTSAANAGSEPTLTDAARCTNGSYRYVSGNNSPVIKVYDPRTNLSTTSNSASVIGV